VTIGSAADLPVAYALSGQVKEATQELEELLRGARTRYVSAYDVASVYAALEKTQLALEWLERAIDQRAAPIIFVALDPAFEKFHREPRFQRIMHRLGLR
jgi:tetratricopeptide (TPR) repeat protein